MFVARELAGTSHVIGIFDANCLERRVLKLMRRRESTGRALRLAMLGACVTIGAVACASALALRVDVTEKAEAKERPVKVGAGVIAGLGIDMKKPVYPAEAIAKKDTVDGPVVLEAIISKEGLVKNLRVKQSLRADYDRSALDAVKDWRYRPYLLNGEPTEVETTITVTFNYGSRK
ncbi:MAG TPA: energy transducer TonB [Edaphobacter sp.]